MVKFTSMIKTINSMFPSSFGDNRSQLQFATPAYIAELIHNLQLIHYRSGLCY